MAGVSEAAQNTGHSASEVRAVAQSLDGQSEKLKSKSPTSCRVPEGSDAIYNREAPAGLHVCPADAG